MSYSVLGDFQIKSLYHEEMVILYSAVVGTGKTYQKVGVYLFGTDLPYSWKQYSIWPLCHL